MRINFARLLSGFTLLVPFVIGNVEKIVFKGPAPANIPLAKPSLSDLSLSTLGPDNWSIRTNLSRAFPQGGRDGDFGKSSWVLLDDLTHDQRYELRICWSAVEPTSFTLDVYELDYVWQTADLMHSLAEYTFSRTNSEASGAHTPEIRAQASTAQGEKKASVLLLHIRAAADYFSDNSELMKNPPPVLVDLTLDPYLQNVLPQSLIPTVCYLIAVGMITWYSARWISSFLLDTARSNDDDAKKLR